MLAIKHVIFYTWSSKSSSLGWPGVGRGSASLEMGKIEDDRCFGLVFSKGSKSERWSHGGCWKWCWCLTVGRRRKTCVTASGFGCEKQTGKKGGWCKAVLPRKGGVVVRMVMAGLVWCGRLEVVFAEKGGDWFMFLLERESKWGRVAGLGKRNRSFFFLSVCCILWERLLVCGSLVGFFRFLNKFSLPIPLLNYSP